LESRKQRAGTSCSRQSGSTFHRPAKLPTATLPFPFSLVTCHNRCGYNLRLSRPSPRKDTAAHVSGCFFPHSGACARGERCRPITGPCLGSLSIEKSNSGVVPCHLPVRGAYRVTVSCGSGSGCVHGCVDLGPRTLACPNHQREYCFRCWRCLPARHQHSYLVARRETRSHHCSRPDHACSYRYRNPARLS